MDVVFLTIIQLAACSFFVFVIHFIVTNVGIFLNKKYYNIKLCKCDLL
jgi:hypothetical protein